MDQNKSTCEKTIEDESGRRSKRVKMVPKWSHDYVK
ncbi:uncharacterized protein G2W53_021904 [Senna tora]|uniref:Uncharacterized protein n=1 Tax=Senna tora TaxID=362788 RepID=A0A834WHN3_9FABA|nr:uncharacterized protein G2W53_021904 [Senna tora]